MEIKRQFESMIQNAEEDYRAGIKDSQSLKGYIMALKKYLASGLADNVDFYDFQDKYALAIRNISVNMKRLRNITVKKYLQRYCLEIMKAQPSTAIFLKQSFLKAKSLIYHALS